MILIHRAFIRPVCAAATGALLLCLAAACGDGGETVWAHEVRSPDGQWVAAARTERWSGPGNAAIITTVRLQRATGRPAPIEVLELAQNADSVDLAWPTASRLDIGYRQPAAVNFQAIRAAGLEIALSDRTRTAEALPVGHGEAVPPRRR